MKVKKAIIPAAGFGTRFLPATKAIPKEMIPIVDTPTIQYIIEEAVNSGIQDILIINGRNKTAIENHFDKSYELENELYLKGKQDDLAKLHKISSLANIHFIRQQEALGLGHAVLCAKSFVGDEPFAVLLGDDVIYSETPCLAQLINVFEKVNSSVLGVQTVALSDVSKYGIIAADKIDNRLYNVHDMVEKPSQQDAPSQMAILGRYILTPEIFDILAKTQKDQSGEIQLTNAIMQLSKKQDVYAYDFIGKRYDIGNKLGFLQATVEYALRNDELKKPFVEYLKETVKEIL